LLVVVGRGASDPDANSNISMLTHRLRDEMGFGWAEIAFTGVAQPRVEAVLTHSARLSFRRIIVFPYFLLTGVLVKQIYAQADAAARLFPGVEFVKALYLRDHPEVLGAFHDRVREVCDSDPAVPRRC
jgi:sirohydrochlorin cobaltochelatase